MQSLADGYSIDSAIGIGGFSTVYRARQDQFDRDVALKILDIRLDDPRAVERFNNECLALGRLDAHPNIADVYAAGIGEHGKPYIAMRWYRAGSVADLLAAKGELPLDQVLAIGRQIADALGAAHEIGIIHRDVKPQNILVSERGQFALSDFGVSALEHESTGPVAHAFTYTHAAPETLDSGGFSPASDQYSLASTLYTLATGSLPFEVNPHTDQSRATKSMSADFSDPRLAEIAPALQRALSVDPQDRFCSMREFATALGGEHVTALAQPNAWLKHHDATVIKDDQVRPLSQRWFPRPALTRPRNAALAVIGVTVVVALARWLMSLVALTGSPTVTEWVSFQSVLHTIAGVVAAVMICTRGRSRSLGYGAALFILASRFKVVTASLLAAAMEYRVVAVTFWAALLFAVGAASALVATSAWRNVPRSNARPRAPIAFWILACTAITAAAYTFWVWAGTVDGVTDFALLCAFVAAAAAMTLFAITVADRCDPQYGLLGYVGAFFILHGVFVLGVVLDLTPKHHLWYELALLATLTVALIFALVHRTRSNLIDLRSNRTPETQFDGQSRQINSASKA